MQIPEFTAKLAAALAKVAPPNLLIERIDIRFAALRPYAITVYVDNGVRWVSRVFSAEQLDAALAPDHILEHSAEALCRSLAEGEPINARPTDYR